MTPVRWSRRLAIFLSALVLVSLAVAPVSATGPRPPSTPPSKPVVKPVTKPYVPKVAIAPIGRYTTGLVDIEEEITAAEIVAYGDGRIFVTNASDNSLDIVSIKDPSAPKLIKRLDLSPFGSSITSAAYHGGLIALAIVGPAKVDPGTVLFIDKNGTIKRKVTVGSLPDNVVFTPDGKRVLVANEGEPADDLGYGTDPRLDPEGSISVIPTQGRKKTVKVGRKTETVIVYDPVRTIDFRDFNVGRKRHRELPSGVRIFGPGASVAQDLEPEYIAVSGDSRTAWVTLQENNAVAILDLKGLKVRKIVALGTKDHSKPGAALDASDRDGPGNAGAINIANWPIRGLFLPDGIATFKVKGKTYLLTANEGDARAWGGFSEEARVGDLFDAGLLDPAVYPAAIAKDNDALSRLTVTTTLGKNPTTGLYDKLHVFGARSFTVWDDAARLIWDSGDALERITAAANPQFFNSDSVEDSFDNRSDNKGPEPESVTTGVIGSRTYAFVGLERIGGIVVYDVSDPKKPQFVQYANTRAFVAEGSIAGPDSAPEGLKFVPAKDSPTKQPLLLVSNEVSGTVVIYQIHDPNGAAALSLFHSNDGESTILPLTTTVAGTPFRYGGVAAYASVVDREIAEARAGFRSVANVYAGDALLASAAMSCSLPPNPPDVPLYDALAQRQIPFDAHILGNHEFDFSPDLLERFIREFKVNGVLSQPFLSANLDFSGEPGFADLLDPDGLIVGASTDGRVVARALLHVDDVTGDRFGIVAATTPLLPTISSPRNVLVTSDDDASTAKIVQAEIDRLQKTYGVTKIIFVSHLQAVTNDLALVALLKGVDVAVAGGGDELLASAGDVLQPGESQVVFGTYPLLVSDAAGKAVRVVTTPGNYRYVGRLDVAFDAKGQVKTVDQAASGPVRVIPQEQTSATALATLGVTDAVASDAGIVASVVEPVSECLAELANPIASTEVLINVSNPAALGFPNGVRNGETNGGDLVADAYLHSYDQYAASFGLPPRGGATKVVAVQNGGGIRQGAGPVLPTTGVAPGPISRQDTLNVMAFLTNIVAVVPNVIPADFKEILERSVSAYPANEGRFLQVGGFRIVVDPSRTAQVTSGPPAGSGLQYGTITTAGERVRSVTLQDGTPIVVDGAVVAGAPNVTIVTNNFTAFQGGDNYPTFPAQPLKITLPVTYEQSVVDYLLSFPNGASGLPTIPASDARYALPGGEGRITTVAP